MTAAINASFREGKLFSELGLDWARPGDSVSMQGYGYFPTFRVPG
jgi:hypothetical protein